MSDIEQPSDGDAPELRDCKHNIKVPIILTILTVVFVTIPIYLSLGAGYSMADEATAIIFVFIVIAYPIDSIVCTVLVNCVDKVGNLNPKIKPIARNVQFAKAFAIVFCYTVLYAAGVNWLVKAIIIFIICVYGVIDIAARYLLCK